jgi:hypothetical protein
LQAELDSIKLKETDHPQAIDDKFNQLTRFCITPGSTLTSKMKKTHMAKIMPPISSGYMKHGVTAYHRIQFMCCSSHITMQNENADN